MKIWVKVIIVGIIIFFVGPVYTVAVGGSIVKNPEGMLISYAGIGLVVIGVLVGIIRFGRRMMNE